MSDCRDLLFKNSDFASEFRDDGCFSLSRLSSGGFQILAQRPDSLFATVEFIDLDSQILVEPLNLLT